MLKQDNRNTRKKTYELPALAVGDVLLVGKFKNRKASAVTSKPANGGHPKTGQWKTRLGQHLLYPAQPRSGKEFQGKTFLWRAPEGRDPRSGW